MSWKRIWSFFIVCLVHSISSASETVLCGSFANEWKLCSRERLWKLSSSRDFNVIIWKKKALLLLFENTSANANPAATAPCIDRGIEEEHFSLWVNRTQAATAMLVAA